MEAIPKSDIKSDISFDISIKPATGTGHYTEPASTLSSESMVAQKE